MALGFLAIYLYLKQRYYFTALVIGISAIIKETAIFFVIFIVLHYVLNNREKIIMQISSSLYKQCFGFIKTPLITALIIIASFLIPLAIYDNTIEVLEYKQRIPVYYIHDQSTNIGNGTFTTTLTPLIIQETKLEMFDSDLRFVPENKIKDPIHHIRSMFFNGYYLQNTSNNPNQFNFINTFIPKLKTAEISSSNSGQYLLITAERPDSKGIYSESEEKHGVVFDTKWYQAQVNYSWWFMGFWSCIALVGYFIFRKFRNNIPISKDMIFIICGFVFFVPYLLVNMMRDSYAYYMIYFLPFMAFGLITIIYKIQNNTRRHIILLGLLAAILFNFVYFFPIRF